MNLNILRTFAILFVALAATAVQAGVRPEALRLKGYDVSSDGDRLAVYAVRCSNRTEPVISSAKGVRKWCSEGQCFRDKIDAAKAACENSLRERVAQSK